jgi:hypothetical protein
MHKLKIRTKHQIKPQIGRPFHRSVIAVPSPSQICHWLWLFFLCFLFVAYVFGFLLKLFCCFLALLLFSMGFNPLVLKWMDLVWGIFVVGGWPSTAPIRFLQYLSCNNVVVAFTPRPSFFLFLFSFFSLTSLIMSAGKPI